VIPPLSPWYVIRRIGRIIKVMNIRSCSALFSIAALVTTGTALATAQAHDQHRPPDHLNHRFEDAERYAKSFDNPERDKWQMPDRVIDALRLDANDRVADIGAGTGYFTVRLAKAVSSGQVYAVDIEPSMLAYIKKRAAAAGLTNVATVHATSASPQLPARADVVLIVDTYHHLPNRASYFSDLKKALTADGRVAIVDFRKDSPEGPPREFRFDAEQIISEMKQAGYRLDTRHEFLPRQLFLVFRDSSR